MKKILLSGFVIITFIGYALHQRFGDEGGSPSPRTPQNMMGNAAGSTMMHGMMGVYKNGTYTGSIADAYYGNIQVQAVISNGKITDVKFLQYPNDRRTSIEINTQAMPYLKEEAIQAQNANVDGVSGATQTSQAFLQSLQSALDQAK